MSGQPPRRPMSRKLNDWFKGVGKRLVPACAVRFPTSNKFFIASVLHELPWMNVARQLVERQMCFQGGGQATPPNPQAQADPSSSTNETWNAPVTESPAPTVPESTRAPPSSLAEDIDAAWLKWGNCDCQGNCKCKYERKPQAQVADKKQIALGSFGKVSSALLGEEGLQVAMKEPHQEEEVVLGNDFGYCAMGLAKVSHSRKAPSRNFKVGRTTGTLSILL
jgi:hypothetical protein